MGEQTYSKNLGLTWTGRWHVLDPAVRAQQGSRRALCGVWVYPYNGSIVLLPKPILIHAQNPNTPKCARCWNTAERKGVVAR